MIGYVAVAWAAVAICLAGMCAGFAGATSAEGDADEKRAVDRTAVQGTWTCVSAVVDGKPLPEKVAGALRLTLTAERYKTERAGEVLFDSTYRLAPSETPGHIDMIGTEGDAAGKTAPGIYAIEGDVLKVCYVMPGGERPKTFESGAGAGVYLVTWKRAEK